MSMENWPFIIVRCFGTGARNNDFIRCTFEAQKQHPGLINEIWFSGYRFKDWDYNEKFVQESLLYRDECSVTTGKP